MSNKLLIKKIFYGLLVFTLMIIPIMKPNAADGYTITITAKDGMKQFTENRFTAYQLFSGKLNAKEDNQLSDIGWGSGVNSANLVSALKTDSTLNDKFKDVKDEDSALQVAEILEKNKEDNDFLRAFSRVVKNHKNGSGTNSTLNQNNAVITVAEPGYYLIIDNDDNNPNQKNSISDFILEVLNNKTVTVKADIPSITKNVNGGKGTTAEIGSDVTFTLTGTIASTYDRYESYYYEFNDTLGDGFTLNQDSVKVKIGNQVLDTSKYKKTITNNTLKIEITDLKKIDIAVTSDSEIIVEYTAKVNDKAKINNNDNGNKNQAKIVYSNDPNDNTKKGETATTTVYVYTFSLDITKIDSVDTIKLLSGAKFVLIKDNKYAKIDNNKLTGWIENKAEATELTTDASGKIHIEGLAVGTYSLEEIEAPIGYDMLKNPVDFTIEATIDTAGNLTSYNVKITSNNANVDAENNGNLAIKVPNNYSKVLPSTGGIGTIIFYVIGGLLLVGASCYIFFAKKKEK